MSKKNTMPRQARLDAPGLLQHVMARGIERRKIFMDDQDRSSFLERLALILEDTQTQCYAWALIPNHFHILLRTGPTPLSTVMRRLMTGYAVTFNIRHRRSGHLFQNRYKSVVCEEDTYLLELTRYIHLNPLRARLVEDLKSLDKYQWSGHSVLMGKKKNPLVPEIPPSDGKDRYLAEKTVEDVLQFFGKSLKEARRRYRVFVEKGVKQGRREDLQGGGLVRSAGGDRASLMGQKKEDRERADQRILGSGDFVSTTLQHAERILEKKYLPKRPIEELIEVVAERLDLTPELICSGSRKRLISNARALLAYLAVEETGHKATDVARILGIKRVSVHHAAKKGKKVLENLPSQL